MEINEKESVETSMTLISLQKLIANFGALQTIGFRVVGGADLAATDRQALNSMSEVFRSEAEVCEKTCAEKASELLEVSCIPHV